MNHEIYRNIARSVAQNDLSNRVSAYNHDKFYMKKENISLNEDVCNSSKLVMIEIEESARRLGNIGGKILLSISLKLKEEGEDIIYFEGDQFLIVAESSLSFEHLRDKIDKIVKDRVFFFEFGCECLRYQLSFFVYGSALKISLSSDC